MIDARIAIEVGEGDGAFRVDAELLLAPLPLPLPHPNVPLEQGVLVLFGASGVGKTLTLKAMAGLIPARGHVRVRGETWLDTEKGILVPAHARRVGYVPQEAALFPFLDVAANVAFGLPRAERKGERVLRWMEELGVSAIASRATGSLSGGERQRVALARALVVRPRVLLLDEPFASLDGEAREAMRSVVRGVVEKERVPVVMVTHDAEEARAMGGKVVGFARGRTV